MSGIALLVIFAIWIWASVWLTRILVRRIAPGMRRQVMALAILVVLLVLPVLDEVIGRYQFHDLCAREAVLVLGVTNPEGRVVRYKAEPSNARVPGTAIPILRSHIEYHDTTTGELIAQYDSFVAKGGLAARALGLSESNSPLTIGSPVCSGEGSSTALPVRLKFQVAN